LVGKTAEVLVEGIKGGKWWGRTRGDKLVFFSGGANRLGELVQVRVEKSTPLALQGTPD
jgi:tRNA A37 methylthiotransferase MiaB